MDGPTVKVVARVPVDLADSFATVASNEDRTLSAAIRHAMRRYVEAKAGDTPTARRPAHG